MPLRSRRPATSWLRAARSSGAALLLAFGTLQCRSDLDLCAPTDARLGFFSKGDCLVTRASFFQGHEWLTWLGNRDLPESARFTDDETRAVAEGNRRVDWPLELLVHLNNGVAAYALALTAFTNRPENQKSHFLLTDRNDTPAAFAEASGELSRLALEAAQLWPMRRERALALIGQAQHLVQDSFSEAHAVREPDNVTAPWCVRSIKAYIERADGFDTDDISYHGVDEDEDEGVTFGHTTPQDSLYRAGRDCHEPTDQASVERCLSEPASRARLASRDHLSAMLRIVAERAEGEALERLVELELDDFRQRHLVLCP